MSNMMAEQMSEMVPVSDVFQFIGWLSGDIKELRTVETPRLLESWHRFRAASDEGIET